jgi:hypothetical protein
LATRRGAAGREPLGRTGQTTKVMGMFVWPEQVADIG